MLAVKRNSPSFHELTASEPIQNGYSSALSINHLSISRLSLDMQRVNSGALPKHMTANTIVYSEMEGQRNKITPIQDELDSSDILSDINSTAVEIGSVDSHFSVGNDLDYNTSLTDEQPHETTSNHSPLSATAGMSQSVTELPIATYNIQDDVYKRAYQSHSSIHKKAKKTESLPRLFRKSHEIESRSNSSVPSSGTGPLNLQNVSMEDVHCVSKLQMDQIWQEVESSSSLTSPQELTSPPANNDDQSYPLDAIFTQTSTEHLPLKSVQSAMTFETKDSETTTSNVRRNSSSTSNRGILLVYVYV